MLGHFEKIEPNEEQVQKLYQLLTKRAHSISHSELPQLSDHRAFVLSHPYRAWYLMKFEGRLYGSFYLTQMNEIGINFAEDHTNEEVAEIVNFVQTNYEPLPPIPSVRGRGFFVNVPASNKDLQKTLDQLGYACIQHTYALKH